MTAELRGPHRRALTPTEESTPMPPRGRRPAPAAADRAAADRTAADRAAGKD